jgi:hypothetical protein
VELYLRKMVKGEGQEFIGDWKEREFVLARATAVGDSVIVQTLLNKRPRFNKEKYL